MKKFIEMYNKNIFTYDFGHGDVCRVLAHEGIGYYDADCYCPPCMPVDSAGVKCGSLSGDDAPDEFWANIDLPDFLSKSDFQFQVENDYCEEQGRIRRFATLVPLDSCGAKLTKRHHQARLVESLDDADCHHTLCDVFFEFCIEKFAGHPSLCVTENDCQSGSRYILIDDENNENNEQKIRFSDHANTSRDWDLPTLNIVAGGDEDHLTDRFSDAVKLVNNLIAAA